MIANETNYFKIVLCRFFYTVSYYALKWCKKGSILKQMYYLSVIRTGCELQIERKRMSYENFRLWYSEWDIFSIHAKTTKKNLYV